MNAAKTRSTIMNKVNKELRSGQVIYRVWYNEFSDEFYVTKFAPIGAKVNVYFKTNNTVTPGWRDKNQSHPALNTSFVPLAINGRYFKKKKHADKFARELNSGIAQMDDFTKFYLFSA